MNKNQILNLIYHYDDFYKESNLKFTDINQVGGSFKLEYNNEIYKFDYNDNLFFYRTIDGKDDCITIGINKEEQIISINNITADDNFCVFQKYYS